MARTRACRAAVLCLAAAVAALPVGGSTEPSGEPPAPGLLRAEDIKGLKLKQLRREIAARGAKCHGCTDKTEYVARLGEVLHLPAVFLPEAEAEKAGWGRGADKLAHLTAANFATYAAAASAEAGASSKNLLLLFHGWGSKAAKPSFAQLARELPELAGAAVDCGGAGPGKQLCEEFGVSEYPQVGYLAAPLWQQPEAVAAAAAAGGPKRAERLAASVELFNHTDPVDGMRAPLLVPLLRKWVRRRTDPTWVAPLPAAWAPEPLWAKDPVAKGNGNVVHLDATSFDGYRQQRAEAMFVVFYANANQASRRLKADWVRASTQRPRQVFAAVDCAAFEASDFCPASRAVNKKAYPAVRYFERLIAAAAAAAAADGGRKRVSPFSAGGEYGERVPTPGTGWSTAALVELADAKASDRIEQEAARELGGAAGGGNAGAADGVSGGGAGAEAGAAAVVDYSKLSVKLLKKLLKQAGTSCTGCTDKREFVAKAEEALGQKQQPAEADDQKEL
eukprot:SAG22_NODE_1275_length_4921_cov_1.871215_1_plen_506_part_00